MGKLEIFVYGVFITILVSLLMISVYWIGFDDGQEQDFFSNGYSCEVVKK